MSEVQPAGPRKTAVLCLGVAPHWVTLWLEREDVSVVGLVDLYEEAKAAPSGSPSVPPPCSLAAQVASWRIPLFADIAEALAALEPDLVTMVTPPAGKTCLTAVETVLRQGYDLFLEKPRLADRQDGARLLQWSRSLGRQIGVGEAYRFDGLVEKAKQVIDSGQLGRIGQIVWTCYRPVVDAPWMKAYDHVMLEDLTYHLLGVIHYLVGLEPFNTVYATSVCPEWSLEASPNVVSLLAQSESGCQLTYHASWSARGKTSSWLGNFRIEGSRGTLELCDGVLTLTVHLDNSCDGNPEKSETLEAEVPYPYELRKGTVNEYVAAWRDKRLTELTIDALYPVLRMIYAAVESAETGKPVEMK